MTQQASKSGRIPSVVLTGASGFIGRHLMAAMTQRDWKVKALSRTEFRLPAMPEKSLFEGADWVIHAAYQLSPGAADQGRSVNIEGTQRLREVARAAGVPRFLFLSSFSAKAEAESVYGQVKWTVEQQMNAESDLVVRPGLVLGDGGLYSRLVKSISSIPLIPLFYGGRQPLQTIHVRDLCQGILRAIELDLRGTLTLAETESVEIREFYAAVARGLGKSRVLLSLPGDLSLGLFRIAEKLGLKLPVNSENLLGLKHMSAVDVRADLARLGLEPMNYQAALAELAKSTARST